LATQFGVSVVAVSLANRLRRFLPWVTWIAVFGALSALTQLGGMVLLIAALAGHLLKLRRSVRIALFILLYALMTAVIVPKVAPYFGRTALACLSGDRHYRAQSILYCATNRNYVRPAVKAHLVEIADVMASRFPGTIVTYLDANFPFADGFPLPPHLSHKDGRKLDLALFYQAYRGGGAWPIGYWAFTTPAPGKTSACLEDGPFRWNMDWLQPILPAHRLDDERTRALLDAIIATAPQKILLEPHLVDRLQLTGRRILFAGCHAARHDDHVHVQWQ
jgi:hypothetical protein